MKTIFKTVVIVGLCAAGIVATAHVVLGKQRTRDAARTLQKMAQSEVDELIAHHADMKEELEKLREDYPRQVATLKAQLKEIERRLEELEKESTTAADIVRMCEEDISVLEDRRDGAAGTPASVRAIEHHGSRYSVPEAERLIARIAQTRQMYAAKADSISAEREQLNAESGRVQAELAAVQTEQAEFEVQYNSLVREIEGLRRNEEMIKLAEKRRGRGRECHAEAMSTLDQVKGALERARIEQDERLKSLRESAQDMGYEARAKLNQFNRKQSRASAAEVAAK
jgi:archaellum component FlaC